MAMAANLAAIGRRGLLGRIVAAAKVVRVATIVVPVAAVKVEVDQRVVTRDVRVVAAVDDPSKGLPPKSSEG